MEVGFFQCHSNYSVLVKSTTRGIIVLVIYVDDIIVSRSDLARIEESKGVHEKAVSNEGFGV